MWKRGGMTGELKPVLHTPKRNRKIRKTPQAGSYYGRFIVGEGFKGFAVDTT